jgi:hypothetical protein
MPLVLLLILILSDVIKCSRYDYADVGMWLGDFWVPPEGKVYTLSDVHSVLLSRRVVVIGDSLGRRTASTLAFLLEKLRKGSSEDISVKELDRDADGSHVTNGYGEHEYNVTTGGLHFQWAPLLRSIEEQVCAANVSGKLLRDVSDVVISAGVHDSASLFWTNTTAIKDRKKRYDFHKQTIGRALNCIHNANSTIRIIWRTAPYVYLDYSSYYTKAENKELQEINKLARVECLKRSYCTLVDAEKLLRHKSLGAERIKGDTPQHFGSLARLAVIQLLMRAMDLT